MDQVYFDAVFSERALLTVQTRIPAATHKEYPAMNKGKITEAVAGWINDEGKRLAAARKVCEEFYRSTGERPQFFEGENKPGVAELQPLMKHWMGRTEMYYQDYQVFYAAARSYEEALYRDKIRQTADKRPPKDMEF